MYAKIFTQIYDGTLCTKGPWQALITFQQLLILADKEGVIDMTPQAISRRTTIPLDIIEEGIKVLLLPDPESRSPDEEGKRIVPLSDSRAWGWRLVNHHHYRALKREEDRREYHRNYWNQKRKHSTKTQQKLNNTQHTQQNQPIAYAESYAVNHKALSCPAEEIVTLYHELMPENPKCKVLNASRRSAIKSRWNEAAKLSCAPFGYETTEAGLAAWRKFFSVCANSEFLTGKAKPYPGKPPFIADIDFLFSPKGFSGCLENKYHREAV